MNYRNVNDAVKGLITSGFGRGKAPLNSLAKAENVRCHTGSLVPRPGSRNINSQDFVTGGDLEAVYEYAKEYYDEPNNRSTTYYEYIFTRTDTVYSWSPSNPAKVWELNLPGNELTHGDIWCMPYMDFLYIGNGTDPLYKYDLIDFFEVGIAAPDAPTVIQGVSATTEPIGYKKYKYRYTRLKLDGSGNVVDYVCSPFSDETTYSVRTELNAIVQVEGSIDPQVTNIEIYATKTFDDTASLVGATFYRLDYNAAHVFFQAGLDNSLGDQDFIDDVTNTDFEANTDQHPAEDTTEDWTAPPDGLKYLIVHRDRMYGVTSQDPAVLRYSFLGEPDAWPADNWIDIRRDDGDYITGLAIRGATLYVFKNRSIWSLTGDPDAAGVMEVESGGEATPTQTEIGLGCTAPRSIATYNDDIIVFYSSLHGVYKIEAGNPVCISKQIGSDILGLGSDTAGAVWIDEDGEIFYILMPSEGNTWIYHFATDSWVNDTGINTSCLCVDHNGYLLGIVGSNIRRFYHPDYDTDQGTEYYCKAKFNWLNLRNGDQDAIVRKMLVQTEGLYDLCTLILENQDNDEFVTTFSDNEEVGINGLSGRLFRPEFYWRKGNIESHTYMYKRRRRHSG